MLQPQEQVFFRDIDRTEYPGIVIGSEEDYFWLLVPALGHIYQGHPRSVANLSDRKVFWQHDRVKATTVLFDKSGTFDSDIFWCAKDPKPMKQLLSALRAVEAHGLKLNPKGAA